jgi:hypothetical protein
MTEKEGRSLGIEDDERYRYVRIENGKANLAPDAKARWIKLASVQLRNGTTDYPSGDTVAVVENLTPPGPTVGTASDLQCVQAAILNASTAPRADSQARDWVGYVVADTLGRDIGTPDMKAADRRPDQAIVFRAVKDMLGRWIKDDALRQDTDYDSSTGKSPKVVRVGTPAILAEHEANKQEAA